MITEWLLAMGDALVSWFFDLFPDMDSAESLVVDASNVLGPVMSGAGALGAWMPWDVLTGTFTVVIGLYVAMLIAKMGKNVLGHIWAGAT